MNPLKENLTMDCLITVTDAIAQLTEATGLDDQQLLDQMPALKDHKGVVLLGYLKKSGAVEVALHPAGARMHEGGNVGDPPWYFATPWPSKRYKIYYLDDTLKIEEIPFLCLINVLMPRGGY